MDQPNFCITTQFQLWDGTIRGLGTLDDGTFIFYCKKEDMDINDTAEDIKKFLENYHPQVLNAEQPELVYRGELFSVFKFKGNGLTIIKNSTYSLHKIPQWLYDDLSTPNIFETKFPRIRNDPVGYGVAVSVSLKMLDKYPCVQ